MPSSAQIVLALLGAADALSLVTPARSSAVVSRASTPQMGVGLIYSTTTGTCSPELAPYFGDLNLGI